RRRGTERRTRRRAASNGDSAEFGRGLRHCGGHAQRDDAVRPEQITAAFATIVAYLALGALSYHLAVPHRFRPWMPWAFVTGDAGFLLTHIGLDVVTTGLGGNYVASLPVLWLAPTVLAFGALQYNPARLLYATA